MFKTKKIETVKYYYCCDRCRRESGPTEILKLSPGWVNVQIYSSSSQPRTLHLCTACSGDLKDFARNITVLPLPFP